MKLLLLLLSFNILLCTSCISQEYFSLISYGDIILYSFNLEKFTDIKTHYNIYDYEFTLDGLFIVTDNETDLNHYQYNQPPPTHLYYTPINLNGDSLTYSFAEIDFPNVSNILLSPDKNMLLISHDSTRNINEEFTDLNTIMKLSKKNLTRLIRLNNYEVIGWFSNSELLVQDIYGNNGLQLYNIINSEFTKYENTLDLDKSRILRYNRIDEHSTLILVKEGYKDSDPVALVNNINGLSKIIYSTTHYYIEYAINQHNEIFLVEYNHDSTGTNIDLVKIDLAGNIINRINLNELLSIKNQLPKVYISENIYNDKIIVLETDPWNCNVFELDLKDMKLRTLGNGNNHFSEARDLRLF